MYPVLHARVFYLEFIWSSSTRVYFILHVGLWVRYFPLIYPNLGRPTGWMPTAKAMVTEHVDVVVDVDAVVDQLLKNPFLREL